MNGQIVKIISNLYTVKSEHGLYECRARGKFKNLRLTPLVGDEVVFSPTDLCINEIKPRKNELRRPMIANVDACIIVTSLKRPDFASNLLDKMLTSVMLKDIEPLIVFTKYDLLSTKEKDMYDKIIKYYNDIGIKAYLNTEPNRVLKTLRGKNVVLCGQTGVGKSTFMNQLDSHLNLKTHDISLALGRGVHTTRHVELFTINDVNIADTPGFSAFDIDSDDVKNIRFTFPEFRNECCEFRDCTHIHERGCQVLKDLDAGKILPSRYESYKKMVNYESSSFLFKN